MKSRKKKLYKIIIFLICFSAVFIFSQETGAKKKLKEKNSGSMSGDIIRKSIRLTRAKRNRALSFDYVLSKTETRDKNILIFIGGANTSENDHYLDDPLYLNFAEENDIMLLTVYFIHDERDFNLHRSFQFAQVWSGKAMDEIIGTIEKEHNINISRYFLLGHSAGAQFVLRYALYFSGKVAAVWASSPGDTDRVTSGRKRENIDFNISCGTLDERYPYIKEFFIESKKVLPNLHFYPIQGIGHKFPDTVKKMALDKFTQLLKKENEPEK